MRAWIAGAAALALGCGGGDAERRDGAAFGVGGDGLEPPVATDAESPITYPRPLYEQGVEGTVVLRLFVDETGALVPDSTAIAESSGYGALDSAALAGVAGLHFAPAWRDGASVATAFLQPVHFRRSTLGAGDQP